jgi:hypothetical protein
MGARRKHSRDGEGGDDHKLVVAWHWAGRGAVDFLPATNLSLEWLQQHNISEDTVRNTGLYYPVYEEEINGTWTKSTTENSDG